MSILDANIKRSLDPKQFFQTLPEQIDALCSFLSEQFDKDVSILDVGSGEGNIKNGLIKNGFKNVKTLDKYFDADYQCDFLKCELDDHFDIIVSNPPYIKRDKTKYLFIDKAIKYSDNSFFMFPLQMLNYIYFCENYLDKDFYGGRLTLYPKVILNPEGQIKQGGNTGYGWFWFSEGFRGKVGVFEQFIDTRQYRPALKIVRCTTYRQERT